MVNTGNRHRLLAANLAVAFVLLMMIGCGGEDGRQYETPEPNATEKPRVTIPVLSDAAQTGEVLFNANCSLCHGANASGSPKGPTLVHKVYEPGHHADFSFRNAVGQGVQEHHWLFGDMPPVPGIAADDVDNIICYIRELQRANSVFEGLESSTVC